MGAFNDFFQANKALIGEDSLVPYGGTIIPTSDGFPVILAQFVRGGTFVVPTLEVLADIPYFILQKDMEVIVSEHERPGDVIYPRTKLSLFIMPEEGLRVSEIPGYVITDYWIVVSESGGDDPGPQGEKGWAPVISNESDGVDRVVQRVIDFIGGQGTKPSIIPASSYIGASGFTTKSTATNIKGTKGADALNARPEAYFSSGTKRTTPPATTFNVTAGVFKYTGESLLVENTFSGARRFLIQGEVPFSNDSGSDSWVVMLMMRTNPDWLPNPDLSGGQVVVDENYSRSDFVNAAAHPSLHKIYVRFVVSINAGGKLYFRLASTQTNGGASKYENGFLEAIGL